MKARVSKLNRRMPVIRPSLPLDTLLKMDVEFYEPCLRRLDSERRKALKIAPENPDAMVVIC